MDGNQTSPFFNVVYYREEQLTDRKYHVEDVKGHFFSTTKRTAGKFRQWQFMTPRPKDPEPVHPLQKCKACNHVFFPDKFYSHACGQKAPDPPKEPRFRGVISSSVVLYKNDLTNLPAVGAPLYIDKGTYKIIRLNGDASYCIGIYAGEGPLINNENGGVDRSILVLLQQ